MEEKEGTIFSLDSWKALILATVAVALVVFILAWQYDRISTESQEKISSLEDTVEREMAKDVLVAFMDARMEKNKGQAMLYLTERSVDQSSRNVFTLLPDFTSYIISEGQRLGDDEYRFTVKSYQGEMLNEMIETVRTIKILDTYYVDSVEVAG